VNHEAIQFVTFESWRLRVFVVKNSCRAVKELRGSSAKPGSNCALGHGRIRISTDRICVRKEKERASSTPPGEWITGWAGMKAPGTRSNASLAWSCFAPAPSNSVFWGIGLAQVATTSCGCPRHPSRRPSPQGGQIGEARGLHRESRLELLDRSRVILVHEPEYYILWPLDSTRYPSFGFFLLEHVGKKVDNMVDGGIPWR